jgi:hypothetical protein
MQFRDLPWIVGNWHWMNSTAQFLLKTCLIFARQRR